jgi:hypothetical protein
MTFYALLELNHVSPYGPNKGVLVSILDGLFLGIAIIAALMFFKAERSWKTLKMFFAVVWITVVMVVYAVKPYIHELRQYPTMLTLLVALTILAGLNLFIYLKRVKGNFQILFRLPRMIWQQIK